jgi:iron complex transport system substrate-binding protein
VKRIRVARAARVAVFLAILMLLGLLSACSSAPPDDGATGRDPLGNGWQPTSTMDLEYAQNFSVDYFNGGYALISISNGDRFLVVPEDADTPDDVDEDIVILKRPVDHIYLVATSTMCLFDALDSLDAIALSGTKADGWYVENAKTAMQDGDILYAGKYSRPDYELILATGCRLAIESTMINHTPEVKEKLQEIGIPVLVEQSSLEEHPLGRTEWIKLYAALMGKEDVAENIFNDQIDYLDSVSNLENTGKTVAFFYINSMGSAVVRKPGDYVTKMIDLAGGNYIFDELGDPTVATSTVTMEFEAFYAAAKDADFIIYNSTIDGGVFTIDQLIGKSNLLADFKAVKTGNVWCTEQNLYQETTKLGLMTADIHQMLVGGDDLEKLSFMYKLQ